MKQAAGFRPLTLSARGCCASGTAVNMWMSGWEECGFAKETENI